LSFSGEESKSQSRCDPRDFCRGLSESSSGQSALHELFCVTSQTAHALSVDEPGWVTAACNLRMYMECVAFVSLHSLCHFLITRRAGL
jgi:hypothetical protein